MSDRGLEDGIQGVEDGAAKPPQHGGYRDPQSKQHIRTRTSKKTVKTGGGVEEILFQ